MSRLGLENLVQDLRQLKLNSTAKKVKDDFEVEGRQSVPLVAGLPPITAITSELKDDSALSDL